MAATLVTVSATYRNVDGTAAVGTVTFKLNEPIANSGTIYHLLPQVAMLDGNGTLSQSLVANDDSGTTPTGTFYMVTERLKGAPEREYQFVLSHTVTSVDLSALMPNTQPGIG